MAQAFELSVEPRNAIGTRAVRRMRTQQENIPAIIYGAHKENEPVFINYNTIKQALQNEAFYSHILTLNVKGEKQKVVLKKVQREPGSDKVIHVDFMRVSAKEKFTMNVPLHFIGEEEAPGVQDDDGVISRLMTEVEIRCLPGNLPEYINVDVSQLKLNESIHLSEITLPEGVELTAFSHGDIEEHDQAIFSIHVPREEPEPAVTETEAAEAEGEGEGEGEGEEASESSEESEVKGEAGSADKEEG